ERGEEAVDGGRRLHADELAHHRPVAEGLHRRDPLDAVAPRQPRRGVDVELADADLTGVLGRCSLQQRRELVAGPAPVGPEVHDHGLPAAGFEDLLLEGGLGHVLDQCGVAHPDPPFVWRVALPMVSGPGPLGSGRPLRSAPPANTARSSRWQTTSSSTAASAPSRTTPASSSPPSTTTACTCTSTRTNATTRWRASSTAASTPPSGSRSAASPAGCWCATADAPSSACPTPPTSSARTCAAASTRSPRPSTSAAASTCGRSRSPAPTTASSSPADSCDCRSSTSRGAPRLTGRETLHRARFSAEHPVRRPAG